MSGVPGIRAGMLHIVVWLRANRLIGEKVKTSFNIILNISKYLTKIKVMTLQNHYNMNIIKYKVKYILYLKIFYRE